MTWRGLNQCTGGTIDEDAHIAQSVRDILLTPVGSRVMRRDYGSHLPALLDAPQNATTHLQLMAATVMALAAFEPRIHVQSVRITRNAQTFGCELDITWQRTDSGAKQQRIIEL
ncbi:MAG: GPW/gp25 family protein [Aeromonas sp.]